MNEDLKQKIRCTLTEACLPNDSDPIIDLYETGSDRIGGAVISKCFAGASGSQRQDRIWSKLDDNLEQDERARITYIITDTPEEYESIARTRRMLWLVEDRDRWGYSLNVVRAGTREEAIGLVKSGTYDRRHPSNWNPDHVSATPLPAEGDPAIIWCHDESPDTPRGDRD